MSKIPTLTENQINTIFERVEHAIKTYMIPAALDEVRKQTEDVIYTALTTTFKPLIQQWVHEAIISEMADEVRRQFVVTLTENHG